MLSHPSPGIGRIDAIIRKWIPVGKKEANDDHLSDANCLYNSTLDPVTLKVASHDVDVWKAFVDHSLVLLKGLSVSAAVAVEHFHRRTGGVMGGTTCAKIQRWNFLLDVASSSGNIFGRMNATSASTCLLYRLVPLDEKVPSREGDKEEKDKEE